MSLYKRKNSKKKSKKKGKKKENNFYWISITSPNGKRVRESTKTNVLQKAKEYHLMREKEIWAQAKLGDKPKYTWEEAVVRYLKDKKNIKSFEFISHQLRLLKDSLSGKFLNEIDTDMIDKIKYARLENIYGSFSDGREYKTSPQTVNKMLAILHAVFIKARDEWMWIQAIPKINFLEVRKDRGRHFVWLRKEEAKALLNELPAHLHAMMKFTLATGLRESNVTNLCWSQIDLEQSIAWVDSIHSKNSCTIEVPLNEDAKKVLASQHGLHPKYVFTYNGSPLKKANSNAWRRALDNAGIRAYFPSKTCRKNIISKYPTKELHEYKHPTFRWHDLRHTWASWHVQSGTPLAVLQKLGGWHSYEMVLRYAHFARSHIAEHANNISLKELD